MKITVAAALTASLLAMPALAHEGEDQDQAQGAPACINPEQVSMVFTSHNMQVRQLAGPELAAFNAAYTLEFKKPIPDVDMLLLVERGQATQVFSFKDGCMVNQGRAQTDLIHKLLGAE